MNPNPDAEPRDDDAANAAERAEQLQADDDEVPEQHRSDAIIDRDFAEPRE